MEEETRRRVGNKSRVFPTLPLPHSVLAALYSKQMSLVITAKHSLFSWIGKKWEGRYDGRFRILRYGADTFYSAASCAQFPFSLPSPPTSFRPIPLPSHHRGSLGHSAKLSIEGDPWVWEPLKFEGKKDFIPRASGFGLPESPARGCRPRGPGPALGPLPSAGWGPWRWRELQSTLSSSSS